MLLQYDHQWKEEQNPRSWRTNRNKSDTFILQNHIHIGLCGLWTASYIHAIQFIDARCQKALGPRLHQHLFPYPLVYTLGSVSCMNMTVQETAVAVPLQSLVPVFHRVFPRLPQFICILPLVPERDSYSVSLRHLTWKDVSFLMCSLVHGQVFTP